MSDSHRTLPGPGGIRFIELLSSMHTGLFLLALLAAASAAGSLVPQGEAESFYKLHYGKMLGGFIVFLSLDRLYGAWWFIALGSVFSASILACSLRRIKKLSGMRGLGSLFIHLGILVVFAGSVISGVSGQSRYAEIGVGDTADLSLYGFPGAELTIRDFRVEYHQNLDPSQYVSAVTLRTGGGEMRQEISVNRPLKYDGLKIFQKSYGWMAGGKVTAGGEEIPFSLPGGGEIVVEGGKPQRMKFIFIPDFDGASGTLQSKSPLPNNPRLACALIQGNEPLDIQVIPRGETKDVGGYRVEFSDYRYYSGLEIKRDPALPVVFTGFSLVVAGFLFRYLKGVGSSRPEGVK